MRFKLSVLAFVLIANTANAAIVSKTVEYKSGDATLKGTLVYNDSFTDPLPGVVIYPEWWGHNEYVKRRAADIVQLGYVAFAADMYGNGNVTNDPKVAGEWSKKFYDDRKLMRERAKAALETLKAQPQVDKTNIALVGFCFGGTNALELARAGENVKGVVGFHAGLDFKDAVKKDSVKAKVLVLNGANDPMVKFEANQKFVNELQEAKTDVELDLYGGAKHAFSNPDADKFGIDGVAYDAKAEARSMVRLREFLKEIFGR